MKTTTIIVAGGSGSRMGSALPKQFLEVAGRPLLMETMERFAASVNNYVNNFVVVLPQAQMELWKQLCCEHGFAIEHRVVAGGATRFHSVKNGLSLVEDADIVLIHDGVRPFIDSRLVSEVIEAAYEFGAAVPVVEVTDTLRKIVNNLSITVNRADYRAVQTPQGFRRQTIAESYEQTFSEHFTDDASVVESAGHRVTLTRGDAANFKITTPVHIEQAQYQITTENREDGTKQ
ncbi:2-C-methyl-D-erythritol 4-phosphate cytidylyltransferase [Mucinivorans hirudinis]|uniref:2-C-methyl-D-erythritol 4-phosphate cytidylyltransferase n=1 Tax=Mucinivorans hirudinis TaxID=1433126 RepID=A0A060R800_9BACT|nr:2-C-methyl-D-erythritol 4-phosphate cytidylyltransferase [Mucinivorans hirudinis]